MIGSPQRCSRRVKLNHFEPGKKIEFTLISARIRRITFPSMRVSRIAFSQLRMTERGLNEKIQKSTGINGSGVVPVRCGISYFRNRVRGAAAWYDSSLL